MNEVTKIHLGRQAFTIANDAYKELHNYLEAIKSQVADSDVVEEIEFRMVELLTEHGIVGGKVILDKDVKFLKSQLGDPKDFHEDSSAKVDNEAAETKRLYRDTETAVFAGVASGLSAYLGVDVLTIRILFIVAFFSGGWGVLLYIALWLLVPEAKTSSERLHMAGKPVTIHSLREVVARADVAGATKRVNKSLAGPINAAFKLLLEIAGVGFIIVGLLLLFALTVAAGYVLVHPGNFGQDIFPVGFREHLLLELGAVFTGLISIMIVIFGVSMFKRKWAIKAWATGVLVGLTMITLAGSIVLGADAAPHIIDRYHANHHTVTRSIAPFTVVEAVGDNVRINYELSDTYSIKLDYFYAPNLSQVKTSVSNGTLIIDTSQLQTNRNCDFVCVPSTYNMVITVYTPMPIQIPDSPKIPLPPVKPAPPR